MFDRREKEGKFLQKVTKPALVEFAKNLLLPSGSKRRLLVSQVSTTKGAKKSRSLSAVPGSTDYVEISDVQRYIKDAQLL